MCVLIAHSYPILCNPMDCSLPGSSIHGILQARILEWVPMPFPGESSQPRDRTHVSYVSWQAGSLPLASPGKPIKDKWSEVAQLYLTLWDPMDYTIHGILQATILEWTTFAFSGVSFLVGPMGFPGGASGKEPTCQCRRHKRHSFHPWVGKIPWRRAWQLTPVFLPGESHGQRNLVGYSP